MTGTIDWKRAKITGPTGETKPYIIAFGSFDRPYVLVRTTAPTRYDNPGIIPLHSEPPRRGEERYVLVEVEHCEAQMQRYRGVTTYPRNFSVPRGPKKPRYEYKAELCGIDDAASEWITEQLRLRLTTGEGGGK